MIFMGNCLLTKGKENLQMDLLWTNPSPTADFAAQTINLNLADYIAVIVISKTHITGSHGYTQYLLLIGTNNNEIGGPWLVDNADHSINTDTRQCSVTTTGVTFTTSRGENTAGSAIIPYQIYGIKQFKFIQKYVSGLQGIDTNNVITTITSDWTATQDCFAVQSSSSAYALGINGVTLCEGAKSGSTDKGICWIPVKKGQIVNPYNRSTKIYGILGE